MQSFTLTELEEKRAKEFMEAHKTCKPKIMSTNGFPKYTYIITPFSLGDMVSIRCNICNCIEEITDIDSW